MSLNYYDGGWRDLQEVKRFDGASWNRVKDIRRWDGSSWVSVGTPVPTLYYEGSELINSYWYKGIWSTRTSFDKYDSYMKISAGGTTLWTETITVLTSKDVSLAGYDNLYIDWRKHGTDHRNAIANFGIGDGHDFNRSIQFDGVFSRRVNALNISGYGGDYYPMIRCRDANLGAVTCAVDVYNIWMS